MKGVSADFQQISTIPTHIKCPLPNPAHLARTFFPNRLTTEVPIMIILPEASLVDELHDKVLAVCADSSPSSSLIGKDDGQNGNNILDCF